jgi:hypothetical protein
MIPCFLGFSKVGVKCLFTFGKLSAEMWRPIAWPICFFIYSLQSR